MTAEEFADSLLDHAVSEGATEEFEVSENMRGGYFFEVTTGGRTFVVAVSERNTDY